MTEPDKRVAEPPAADRDRSPGRAKGGLWLIIALGALSGFGPLCLDMYLPALPQLPADLSSTSAAAQLTLSSCIVGLAVGQLITGPLSDRLGRRGPLLVGVAIFVIASVICAVTTSMTVLIAVRLVQGAAGAAGIVVGRAVVADMFAGKVAAAYFSAIATINGLAPILAPVIGGQVLRVGTWRTVFWVLAGIGVLMLVLAALVIKESLPPERRSSGGFGGTLRAFGTLVRDRGYVGSVLAGSMVTAAMFGYISASPFLLQDGFGLSAQQFSACFALNATGIVLATQIGRVLLRRTTSFALLAWGVGQALAGAIALTVNGVRGVGPGDGAGLAVRDGVRGRVRPAARVGDRDGPAPADRRVGVGAARPDPVRAGRGHRTTGRPRRRHGRRRARRHRAGRDAGRRAGVAHRKTGHRRGGARVAGAPGAAGRVNLLAGSA